MMMMIIITPLTVFLYLFMAITSPLISSEHSSDSPQNTTTTRSYFSYRKLSVLHGTCTNRDLSISQSRDPYTSGIPQFIVEIVNTCVSGCAASNIHLNCGWFASARIVNPRIFKRISYDDCLVNGGKPLKTSQVIRFTYSNTFMYPISFKYAKYCRTWIKSKD